MTSRAAAVIIIAVLNHPIGSANFNAPFVARSPYRVSELPDAIVPLDRLERGVAPAPADAAPDRVSLLRRVGLGICLAVGLMGAGAPAMAAGPPPIAISKTMELSIVGGENKPGKLVDVAEGDPSLGVTVAVHGIRGSPSTIQTVIEGAAAGGGVVKAFTYDDQFRSLEDSSRDLANEIASWKQENPGRPLSIQSHSMGGRIVLGALQDLQERGLLADGAPIHATLIAPPLGGYGSANSARWAPDFVARLIAGIVPGRGMGTSSDFQKMLEALKLPANVETTVLLAENDTLVDTTLPGFQRIVDNLHATIRHVRDADHVNILEKLGHPEEFLTFDGKTAKLPELPR